MEDPMHENQVHNKVIDIAIFFEGIGGYKVWQNCWHNSRKIPHWLAPIFNKIGRLYRRRENFALDPCQSIGHSSGDENYNFTIACQAMPGDFCYNRQLIFSQLPGDVFTIAR